MPFTPERDIGSMWMWRVYRGRRSSESFAPTARRKGRSRRSNRFLNRSRESPMPRLRRAARTPGRPSARSRPRSGAIGGISRGEGIGEALSRDRGAGGYRGGGGGGWGRGGGARGG